MCDLNPVYIDANATCTSGNQRCFIGQNQSCVNCGWSDGSGVDTDNDGYDTSCGDSMCDLNPIYIDANRSCNNGNSMCLVGQNLSCVNCGWADGGGIDFDNDGYDTTCGDSMCDLNPIYIDANRSCNNGDQRCIAGMPQECQNCAWIATTPENNDADAWAAQCGDKNTTHDCDYNSSVFGINLSTRVANEIGQCMDNLDNDCDGTTDCFDSDCWGVLCGPGPQTGCNNTLLHCPQDDCINENCNLATHQCTLTPRNRCDTTECATGYYCNNATGGTTGGDCTFPDTSQTVCTACVPAQWLTANETAIAQLPTYPIIYPFGNYSARGELECCGNNATPSTQLEEFAITTGPRTACCNAPTDCIDETGTCRIGYENTTGLCSNGIDDDCDGIVDASANDPDCLGNISGIIWDGDNIDFAYVVPNVQVEGIPPSLPESFKKNAISNADGTYKIVNAIVGTYNFIARKQGYIDTIRLITVVPKKEVDEEDFYLYTGVNCRADCTDQNGYCNSQCYGLSFNIINASGQNEQKVCMPVQACAGRPLGFQITGAFNETHNNNTICCEGPSTMHQKLRAIVQSNLKSLYDYETPIKIGRKNYIMHILIGDK